MLYTQKQAADITGIAYSKLRYWEQSGKLIPTRTPKGDFYTESQLREIYYYLEQERLEKQRRAILRVVNKNKGFKGYFEHTYNENLYTVFLFGAISVIFAGQLKGIEQLKCLDENLINRTAANKVLDGYFSLPKDVIYQAKSFNIKDIHKQIKVANNLLKEKYGIKSKNIIYGHIEEQYIRVEDWTCNVYLLNDLVEMMGVTSFRLLIDKRENEESKFNFNCGYINSGMSLGVICPLVLNW